MLSWETLRAKVIFVMLDCPADSPLENWGIFFLLSNMLYHHFLLFLAKVWSGVQLDNVGDCKDLTLLDRNLDQ